MLEDDYQKNEISTLDEIDKQFLRKWCIVTLKDVTKKHMFILDTDYELTDDLVVIYNYEGSIEYGSGLKLQDIHSIELDQ